MNGHEQPPDDSGLGAEALRRASDRIERLLGELRSSTAPATWARIHELVSSMTTIYGRGLGRTLEIFAEAAAGIDETTRTALCEDTLVGSLLLLHGLHPSPIEERVSAAVERVRRAMGASGGQIEAAPIASNGSITVHVSGDWRTSRVPPDAIEAALRRAIEEAAPDLVRLDIDREELEGSPLPSNGMNRTPPAASATGLVQIDLTRSRRDVRAVAR